MTSIVEKLIRPEILTLKPYISARGVAVGFAGKIRLDANESPYLPYQAGVGKLEANRYPEQQPTNLINRIAEILQVPPQMLMLTRGMDEAIDIINRAFLVPYKDNILICPPTFGFYKISAQIQGAGIVKVPLTDAFQLDMKAILEIENAKLIYICTPNNPTGNALDFADIRKICQHFKDKAMVIVDEAYIDFADSESAINLLKYFDNLIVLRTLSKAYLLAGARLGIAIAAPETIGLLRKLLPPYPISVPAINFIQKSLSDKGLQQKELYVRRIIKSRNRLISAMRQCPDIIKIYKSDSNFIYIKVKDAASFMKYTADNHILVRNRSVDIENTIRITIGTNKEIQQLIKVLKDYGKT